MPEDTGDDGVETSDTDGTDDQQQQEPDWRAEATKWQEMSRKNEARAKANHQAAQELARVKASQQSETEKAIATARAEAAKETSGKYVARIAGLSIRAAAGGKFQNPEDATALLSGRMAEFVNDEGDVDDQAITKAVDQLLKDRPYLGTVKPPPDFDGGQRNGASGTVSMDRLIRRSVGIQ